MTNGDTAKITVNIPPDLKLLLDRYCKENDRSMSWTIREALRIFLEDEYPEY